MIPNAGLDNIAAYPAWRSGLGTGDGLSSNTNDGSGSQWLAYAAISEDSSEPTASDTNIGTEAMRTNSTGGFSRTATAIRDSGSNRLGVSIERAYVFAIDGNYNITKYGYVPLSTGGNFSWIDLTREDPNDPGSTPVTLSLVPGDELQLWQTFTITVPWSVDLESFVITGTDGNDAAGTHDAYCGFFATGTSLANQSTDISLARLIATLFWPGEETSAIRAIATLQTPNTARDQALTDTFAGNADSLVVQHEPYVSSSYQRDKVYTFITSAANMSITGIMLTAAGGTQQAVTNGYGFKIVFDDPAPFVKDNLHTLTLTFRSTWAEA